MAKRRPSGDGMVRKRDDGRWGGRIVVGLKENGGPILHCVYTPTQEERRQHIDKSNGNKNNPLISSEIRGFLVAGTGLEPATSGL